MSGAQQGYNAGWQHYGKFEAPPFVQQPQIPSPDGIHSPSAPALPQAADRIPLSVTSKYDPAGGLEHSGAQQGYYYIDRQQYGTSQAPPFVQQPQIPSPGGMYYPSVPVLPWVADGFPSSGIDNYYRGGGLEHSSREGRCHHGDPNNLPFCGLGYGWFLFPLVCFFNGAGVAACAILAIMLCWLVVASK